MPPALAEHVDRSDMDVDDMGLDITMSEYRDAPKVSIEREGGQATSTTTPTSIFELVEVSYKPLQPTITTISITIRFIIVPHELLQILMER